MSCERRRIYDICRFDASYAALLPLCLFVAIITSFICHCGSNVNTFARFRALHAFAKSEQIFELRAAMSAEPPASQCATLRHDIRHATSACRDARGDASPPPLERELLPLPRRAILRRQCRRAPCRHADTPAALTLMQMPVYI